MLTAYQLLFELSKLPYIISDTLFKNYSNLEALFFFDGVAWKSYLPKDKVEYTLNEGVKIYSSENEFSSFKNEFENYKKESLGFFEEVIKQDALSLEDITLFIKYIIRFHFYYIKTEFFYTDKVFLEKQINSVIKEHLEQLSDIKNSGRDYLNKIFLGNDSYLSKVLTKVGDAFQVSLDDLMQYSQKEILELWEGKKVSRETMGARIKGYVFSIQGDRENILIGDEALEKIKEITEQKVEKLKILKGTVASKGRAEGKARVMNIGFDNFDKASDFVKEMKEGEILVAQTTSPEIIFACKKAVAIITNQGGMMSHAAIVSRELNIPCIVGVGNATEHIQTGDLLLVDADRGIIEVVDKK